MLPIPTPLGCLIKTWGCSAHALRLSDPLLRLYYQSFEAAPSRPLGCPHQCLKAVPPMLWMMYAHVSSNANTRLTTRFKNGTLFAHDCVAILPETDVHILVIESLASHIPSILASPWNDVTFLRAICLPTHPFPVFYICIMEEPISLSFCCKV